MKILSTVLKTLGISDEEIQRALSCAPPLQKGLPGWMPPVQHAVVGSAPVRRSTALSQVFIVLDTSGSMDEGKLAQARRGGAKFSDDAIGRGYRVGVIQFSSWATLKVAPTENRRAIKEALAEVGLQATTNMASAIRLATSHLETGEGDRAMVIVTDGFPDNPEKTLAAAKEAKRRGITIITIGTDDADREFLAQLASATGLSRKVPREELQVAITDAARLLPAKSSR